MKETTTFKVRTGLLGAITSVVNRLNRRAVRLSVEPIDFSISEARMEVIDDLAFEFVDVTLSLNIPKLADWTFLATIQHLEGGNLLLTVPSEETVDLSAYRTCAPTCQHCNKPRVRRDTYVVRHADGTFKQVGKDCLANFTGYGKSPEQVAQWMEWLSQVLTLLNDPSSADPDGGDGEYYGLGSESGVGLNTFLSYVVAVSRVHGFRTRKQAELTQSSSTKDDAVYNMHPPRGARKEKLIKPTEEDRAYALRAREWAAAIEPKSDFDHNLKVVASGDGVSYRNLGIAAYLVEAFNRELGKRAEFAARPASVHFGTVGERLRKIKLTYKGNYSFDSQFGVTFIHRFSTENGSDAIWKTGSVAPCGVGETIVVDASVKEHGDYKGRPQTVLTRVKVIEEKVATAA